MLTREGARDEILKIDNPNILCELPTSFGKSKIALDWLKKQIPKPSNKTKILIVVPRLVLIQNWKDEFKKWGCVDYLPFVEFVTYVSFPKMADTWNAIIYDECHHLSQRCRDYLQYFDVEKSILLSATVNRETKAALLSLFNNLYVYKVTTKQAIKDEILPDPKVYLIPLLLNNTRTNCEIVKNKSQKQELVIPFMQRFNYAKVKNRRIVIKCTQWQYYKEMSSMIEWYKKKTFNETFKNMFLRKSGERLKWLSDQKTSFILSLLDHIKNQRTLTFCNSILQTEVLGKYCINSSSKDTSINNLAKFNNQEVDHITACNMIDEGVNLVNCRVGVYAVLNSSERMIKQKLGRLLRHPSPIIIIPFYKNTRDEEIVNKMLEDYNQELVSTITDLKDLTL